VRLVEEEGVLSLPGTEFGPYGEGHLRLSVCAKRESLIEGINRLRRFAEDHNRGVGNGSAPG
jgi:aspartate/methionine/tyrosine aminotransferase